MILNLFGLIRSSNTLSFNYFSCQWIFLLPVNKSEHHSLESGCMMKCYFVYWNNITILPITIKSQTNNFPWLTCDSIVNFSSTVLRLLGNLTLFFLFLGQSVYTLNEVYEDVFQFHVNTLNKDSIHLIALLRFSRTCLSVKVLNLTENNKKALLWVKQVSCRCKVGHITHYIPFISFSLSEAE